MEQTKVESMIETITNIFTGFIISYSLWKFVLTPIIERGYLSIDDAFTITMIFTVTSVIRSYYWRRFFARRLHKVIHRWISRLMETTGW